MHLTHPGPISIETDCFEQDVPFYAITFDKTGTCTSPQSLDHLVAALAGGEASDLIMFCHGWNNDWPTAMSRYTQFLRGVSDMAAAHPGSLPDGFRPVFVGLHWPSTALTWPSEDAPSIASLPDDDAALDELRGMLNTSDRAAFEAALSDDDVVDREAARKLAELLSPHLLMGDENDDAAAGPLSAADLLSVWQNAPLIAAQGQGDGAVFDGKIPEIGAIATGHDTAPGVEAQGLFGKFSLRKLLRLTTVLMMKDRAGIVGANGVATALGRVLNQTDARLHLIGHSYGTKVILTALVKADAARPAHSALLMQPAISHLCFADNLGDGRAGGFRKALARIERPILSTFSENDFPLTWVFQLTARRRSDVGEMQIAGTPSRYAALGGYGPSGLLAGEGQVMDLPTPGQPYAEMPEALQVLALDGENGIPGHADVINSHLFWAMLNLLAPETPTPG